MAKLTKKISQEDIDFMIEENKSRLESQVKSFSDEFETYQAVLDMLIFELNMIDEVDGLHRYSSESIISWLEEKKSDLEGFDAVISNTIG